MTTIGGTAPSFGSRTPISRITGTHCSAKTGLIYSLNNRSYLVGILIVVLLLLSGWWFWKSKRVPPAKVPVKAAPISPANPVAPSGTTNQPNKPPVPSDLVSQIAALEKNPKVVAIEAAVAKMNAAPQDFYGKIKQLYERWTVGDGRNNLWIRQCSFKS